MATTRDKLEAQMHAAAAGLDFELAARLRDDLRALDAAAADAAAGALHRQVPGAMGLGTSQQQLQQPPGWTPPRRPDPMTAGHKRRRRRA